MTAVTVGVASTMISPEAVAVFALATDRPEFATWLPGTLPVELALATTFVGELALDPLARGRGTILGTGVLATVAFAVRR